MRRRGLLPGLLLAGAVLLALGYLVQVLAPPGDDRTPAITIISPTPGDTLRDSLIIRFRTGAPLRLEAQGWSAGELHPHARVDGREHMAGPADIVPDGATFTWRLPAPGPGAHTLELGWAGPDHRPRGAAVTTPFVFR